MALSYQISRVLGFISIFQSNVILAKYVLFQFSFNQVLEDHFHLAPVALLRQRFYFHCQPSALASVDQPLGITAHRCPAFICPGIVSACKNNSTQYGKFFFITLHRVKVGRESKKPQNHYFPLQNMALIPVLFLFNFIFTILNGLQCKHIGFAFVPLIIQQNNWHLFL